ncbi:MarR family transcriptional regulator [Pediococcus parvulus]|uniref:MarR family transcriptional regulator n=1 Tax=Pediococcus parvulus TaxID=54062 RepID=A0AAP5T9F1_9LACO|nr:MarR family transcriptional regulator [Pediococcus parvulus]HBO47502.1 MarR family transcriptional regulator [Pediococcus sp.]MCT3030017.1 MarR family transcriptional regulator [Pediococcus parvulus]MCT3035726.1 MarR family transcriptional regulator [Pediococcus parvulus]MDV7693524.1 MarR family transcriptional regulator [Pediococcus parvulus]
MIDDEMKLTNQLCFSVYNASRLFTKFYQKALKPFGLTYPQYLVLLSLWQQDTQTLHELGDKLHLSSNTLTPLLKRLEGSGWVQRIQPDDDHRQLVIKLTNLAKQQEMAIYKAIGDCASHEAFDIKEYEDALKINNKLVDQLKAILA